MQQSALVGNPGLPSIQLGMAAQVLTSVNSAALNNAAAALASIWQRDNRQFPGRDVAGMTEPQLRALPIDEIAVIEALWSHVMESGTKMPATVGAVMTHFGLGQAELAYLVGDANHPSTAASASQRLFDIAKGTMPAPSPSFHHLGAGAELEARRHHV